MIGAEVAFLDPFFGCDDDEPVDMEKVLEGIKHVPLPDLDYQMNEDHFSSDPSTAEHLSANSISALRDHVRQGVSKPRPVSPRADPFPSKRKGSGATVRAPKRVKVEVQTNDSRVKATSMNAVKVENLVGSVRAAQAKVAAEVAPNVLTSGIVAEAGPRPDFSQWTVDDDLLLKNAMEAGAAMEALGKGAMRFSRRFTLKELRERWRALLFDPEVAVQAAARMVEAELAVGCTEIHKSASEPKNPIEVARKRRANSIRTLYYKKRKRVLAETVSPVLPDGLAGNPVGNGPLVEVETTTEKEGDYAPDNLVDSLDVGFLDTSFLEPFSPRGSPALYPLDVENQSFSQMFSLLAEGGVRAVVGASCGTFDPMEPDLEALMEDVHYADDITAGCNDFLNSHGMDGDRNVEEGCREKADMSCPLTVPMCGDNLIVDSCTAIVASVGGSDEDEGTITIADIELDAQLPASSNHAEGLGAVGTDEMQFVESIGDDFKSTQTYDVSADLIIDGDVFCEDVKEHTGAMYSPPYDEKLLNTSSGLTSVSDFSRVCSDNEQSTFQLKLSANINLTSMQVKSPGESAAVDHMSNAADDLKIITFSPILMAEPPLMAETCESMPNENADIDVHVDDCVGACEDTKEFVQERCCECGRLCQMPLDNFKREEDDTYVDRYPVGETEDNYLHSVLTGESCSLDFDVNVQGDNVDAGCYTEAPFLTIKNPVCSVSIEDTDEIPDLSDVLPYPVFTQEPLSPTEEEYLAMLESPINDGREDDEYTAVEGERARNYCVELNDGVSSLVQKSSFIKQESKHDELCNLLPDPVNHGSSIEYRVPYEVGTESGHAVHLTPQRHRSTNFEQGPKLYELALPGATEGRAQSDAIGNLDECPTNFAYSVPFVDAGLRCVDSPNGDKPATSLANVEPQANEERPGPVEPPEEVLESDEDIIRFSDVEAMILDMDLDPVADEDYSARAESRRTYRRHGRELVRLEQGSSAAMQRSLNAREAFAVIYGKRSKYYIRQPKVVIGRATTDNVVDIDLGKEGRANKVSRQQAHIKLKDDGIFYLRNLGRRGVTVNNNAVGTGQRAILGSNCLIEVGECILYLNSIEDLLRSIVTGGSNCEM